MCTTYNILCFICLLFGEMKKVSLIGGTLKNLFDVTPVEKP